MMHWTDFGRAIRAHADETDEPISVAAKRIGVGHSRMINAAQGKPVGTEIYLRLCQWMRADPMRFLK